MPFCHCVCSEFLAVVNRELPYVLVVLHVNFISGKFFSVAKFSGSNASVVLQINTVTCRMLRPVLPRVHIYRVEDLNSHEKCT